MDTDPAARFSTRSIIEAYHLCMMMRGVEKQNSKTIDRHGQVIAENVPAYQVLLMPSKSCANNSGSIRTTCACTSY